NVSDSWGDAALKCFKGQAQAFTELPGRCFEGAILKIVGKADEAGGGYWVKYQKGTASGVDTGSGVWVEYREPYLAHTIDAATMPQQLVRRQNIEKYS
ncbi:phage nozzle protein, partial [Campylobacter lanienae]